MKKFKEPIFVTKSFLPPIEDYKKEIKKIWDSNWLTNNGPLHNEFKKKVSEYLKVKNSTLFVNGHLALDIAIKSLNLKGEVITTPFTFASTTHAIKMNGLKPVFCDIELVSYNIDVTKIEKLITEQTSAIIPVHVFGNPCNVKKIRKIAQKYNLKVIYDAAHTFGVEIDGKGVGNFGDVSMFSLHATKVFHSIEGGILTYNNNNYKEKFDLFKNFGITGPEKVEVVGLNAKMNEFQAAMGIVNLKYIDDEIEKRKKIAYEYRKLLKDIKGIKVLEDIEGVKHNYSYFPILINENEFGINRDELFDKLNEYNIFPRKYFYPLCNEYDCYRDDYNIKETPNAKYVADRIITLPMYSQLSIDNIEKIVDIIKGIKNE
ncbi:dTDP-4-amino-4,6-dideoxygalactose transaminase [Orenia metallireducens]|uniref:DegT/DnrJ/EryC1/StrS family aminotransferase n=1 Tax=Orenia metallireducens TaxID=1413210 RepID=UPI000D06A8F8|nr:DegT/DnrJ/EryC1/StrS family aminotransferase [Orenia metallireducens]PRX35680.1 dTDP-4-amino-4,6-dideoxygalactose transaminase [Orenia metallireducens]